MGLFVSWSSDVFIGDKFTNAFVVDFGIGRGSTIWLLWEASLKWVERLDLVSYLKAVFQRFKAADLLDIFLSPASVIVRLASAGFLEVYTGYHFSLNVGNNAKLKFTS